MEIPCDTTLAAAVAGYLDAGDFTRSSRTTYRRVLEGMARELGPERAVAELAADQLAAWFARTRDAYMPTSWNRDRVIVRAFVRHLQDHGAAVELPAIGHRRICPDTTRALSRADVARILQAPAPLRERTLWWLLYESAARVGEVLALDIEDLDLANRRARVVGKGGQVEWITWSTGHAAPAAPLRADAHGRGRRLRADADDQEPAPVHQQPGPLRPSRRRGAPALGSGARSGEAARVTAIDRWTSTYRARLARAGAALVAELPDGVPALLGAPICQLDHTHDVLLPGRHPRLDPAKEQALGSS
jgi:integrase